MSVQDTDRSESDSRENPDERLVELLAAGETYVTIGRAVRRSPRTVRRDASRPEVKRAVAERRQEMAARAAGRFAALLDEAITVVQEALSNPEPGVRLRAASTVFDRHLSLRREIDVGDSLAMLREEIDELKKERKR
jgi:hypothetical protein